MKGRWSWGGRGGGSVKRVSCIRDRQRRETLVFSFHYVGSFGGSEGGGGGGGGSGRGAAEWKNESLQATRQKSRG